MVCVMRWSLVAIKARCFCPVVVVGLPERSRGFFFPVVDFLKPDFNTIPIPPSFRTATSSLASTTCLVSVMPLVQCRDGHVGHWAC